MWKSKIRKDWLFLNVVWVFYVCNVVFSVLLCDYILSTSGLNLIWGHFWIRSYNFFLFFFIFLFSLLSLCVCYIQKKSLIIKWSSLTVMNGKKYLFVFIGSPTGSTHFNGLFMTSLKVLHLSQCVPTFF